jgi:hypothetical protein
MGYANPCEERAHVAHLVLLGFLARVRPVEGYDNALANEPDARPGSLNHLAAYGNEKALDRDPFDGARHRLGKNRLERPRLPTVHDRSL